MSSELPTVSIITPSYNQAEWLEETILSVLNQDYPNIEYLIFDGGSTDGSIEIIRKYQARLAYWVSEPDQGQADVINKGFARARGEVLGWLNSDDTYEPGVISYVVDYFLKNPEWMFVYGEACRIDQNGKRLGLSPRVKPSFDFRYLLHPSPLVQPATFWQRQLWEKVGPLDTGLYWAFDLDWFTRAYQVTAFHYLPRTLANYRSHPKSKTQMGDIRRGAENASVVRRYGGWWQTRNVIYQIHRIERNMGVFLGSRARPIRPLAKLVLPWIDKFVLAFFRTITKSKR